MTQDDRFHQIKSRLELARQKTNYARMLSEGIGLLKENRQKELNSLIQSILEDLTEIHRRVES